MLSIKYFIRRRQDEAESFNEPLELCLLGRSIAQRLGLRKFDKNTFAKHLIELLKKYK